MNMQQNIAIRRASPGDAEIISSITDAAYEKYVPLLGRKPQPMTTDYRQVLAEHPVWILWIDEHPAGVLVLMHEPGALLIYSVAIAPAYQKRSLGRRLLAWAESQGQEAGYSHIRLFTNALMEANIALYTRLGYVETGREPYQDMTIVHMRKPIEQHRSERMTSALEIAEAWQQAANNQDSERLVALSDHNIELVGPRGSGYGHQLLRDWLSRAGLTLKTQRAFGRGGTIVLAQRGTWRSAETGAVTGESDLASWFEIGGGRVARFARYDSLDQALAAAGLTRADEIGQL
jgi:ribosomal protein S18 acetylase RimI-like enzyme